MAITKTTRLERVEVFTASDPDAADTLNSGNPTLYCVYIDSMDDPDDDDLPQSFQRTKMLERYLITINDDQTTTSTATDVTGEDQLVQDICGAIWS